MKTTIITLFLLFTNASLRCTALELNTNQIISNDELITILLQFDETIERLRESDLRKQERIDHLEHVLRKEIGKLANDVKSLQDKNNNFDCMDGEFQNTTIEELEVRVEQLEVDLFETQNDVLEVADSVLNVQGDLVEVEATVLEIDFNLQELTEQVLNHADSITTLNEVTSGHTEEIVALNDAIDVLESNTIELDDRIAFLENELFERSQVAFLVSLSIDVNITDNSVVPFDVVHYDGGLNYNVSTNTYIVPTDGTYLFYATILCLSDDDDGCGNRLLVDGDRFVFNNEATALGPDPRSRLVVSCALTKGQSVQFVTNNGNDINGGTGELITYFGGHLIVQFMSDN